MTAVPPAGEPALLDWRDPRHWAWEPRECRYCGGPTYLRDTRRKPAHKVCAEQALQQQAADAANAYQTGHIH